MGMSLSGINIYTKNPAQSFNFYKGLGWEVVEEGDWETDWFGAEFRLGELTIWIWNDQESQKPRCKQRGIKLVALQSSGVFDPRGSRQISMQAWLLGSLLAGIKMVSEMHWSSIVMIFLRPITI
ncbi:hypothetical protein [Eisenbergiella porci]|uniref:hypothetical protein n=1 Tax=Eisenbergiella porci TaxID=2652274 RepID=UPI002A7FEC31|nr:hypothetical protein [Eisenbergiella porci]